MTEDSTEKKTDSKFTSYVLPRLPPFSGDDKDCQFDLWHYEVQCLEQENHPESDIKLAIRRSLRGQAQRTLMSLGINASLKTILEKFKIVFGPTQAAQTVMSTFYSLRQREGEDAGSFANRLRNCLHEAVQLGRVEITSTPGMLKEACEAGLRTQTRVAVGYMFRRIDWDFDKLVLEVKRAERELSLNSQASVKSVQESQIKELTAQVAELRTELQSFRQSNPSPQTNVTR